MAIKVETPIRTLPALARTYAAPTTPRVVEDVP
jgi:hypothetical protein